MKSKWIAVFTAVALFCGVNAPVFADSGVHASAAQQDAVREKLISAYNYLAGLSDSEWTNQLNDGADKLEAAGMTSQAKALRAMSDVKNRDSILDTVKSKIDQGSENGLFLVLAYHSPEFLIITLIFFPLFLLLFCLTLDGEQAAAF